MKIYAIGYYYGRTQLTDFATVDLMYKDFPEFVQGFDAGVRDFTNIDLVEQALGSDKQPEEV